MCLCVTQTLLSRFCKDHGISPWFDKVKTMPRFRLEFANKLETNKSYWKIIFNWYSIELDGKWKNDKNKKKRNGALVFETAQPFKDTMHNNKTTNVYLPLFLVSFQEFINYSYQHGLFYVLKQVLKNVHKLEKDQLDYKIKEIKVEFARKACF